MSKNTAEKPGREKHNRLAEECAKLDPKVEQALAEEGMEYELATWPKYANAPQIAIIGRFRKFTS